MKPPEGRDIDLVELSNWASLAQQAGRYQVPLTSTDPETAHHETNSLTPLDIVVIASPRQNMACF